MMVLPVVSKTTEATNSAAVTAFFSGFFCSSGVSSLFCCKDSFQMCVIILNVAKTGGLLCVGPALSADIGSSAQCRGIL